MFNFVTKQHVGIPGGAEKILFAILPKALRDPLMGDLQEEFYRDVIPRYGQARAQWWYRLQVVKSARYYILREKGGVMMFLLSIMVFIALSISAGVLGSSMGVLFNIPSLLVDLVPSFLFAMAATSTRSWTLCLRLLFVDLDHVDKEEIREASRFLKVFGNMCLVLGLFFTLLGAMQILSMFDFSSVSTNKVCSASSVCLLALFYGIAFKSILYVADQRIQHRFRMDVFRSV